METICFNYQWILLSIFIPELITCQVKILLFFFIICGISLFFVRRRTGFQANRLHEQVFYAREIPEDRCYLIKLFLPVFSTGKISQHLTIPANLLIGLSHYCVSTRVSTAYQDTKGTPHVRREHVRSSLLRRTYESNVAGTP